MREVDLHVPFEAAESMGFEPSAPEDRPVEVRDVSVISCDGRACLAAIRYSGRVDAALADADHVQWWERVDRNDGEATYLVESAVPDSADRPDDGRLDVRSVAVDGDGWTVSLVGSQDALGCSDWAPADVPVSVRRVTDYRGPEDPLDSLTNRQREVLVAAHERGYFEVPRQATAEDVAEALDLDRSTVSEHLRRAERNLISTVLSR